MANSSVNWIVRTENLGPLDPSIGSLLFALVLTLALAYLHQQNHQPTDHGQAAQQPKQAIQHVRLLVQQVECP